MLFLISETCLSAPLTMDHFSEENTKGEHFTTTSILPTYKIDW